MYIYVYTYENLKILKNLTILENTLDLHSKTQTLITTNSGNGYYSRVSTPCPILTKIQQ